MDEGRCDVFSEDVVMVLYYDNYDAIRVSLLLNFMHTFKVENQTIKISKPPS